jgi:fermentation-respiration switch protein FrsA (DUF1100 family)
LASKAGTSLVEKTTSIGGGKAMSSAGKIKGLSSAGKYAAGVAGGVAGGYALGSAGNQNQVKQAAVGLLMNVGINFDMAVDLVNAEAKNQYQ